MLCPDCGTDNAANAKFCKCCGAVMGSEAPASVADPRFKKVLVTLVALLCVMVLITVGLVVWFFLDVTNSENEDADTGKTERQEQTDPSLRQTEPEQTQPEPTVPEQTQPEQTTPPEDPTPAPNAYMLAVPGDYAIPDSSARFLVEADLHALSQTQLLIARNEIFARHGYIFEDAELNAYFTSKSWYTPFVAGADFDSSALSAMEINNLELIKAVELYAGENGCTVSVVTAYTLQEKFADGYCWHMPGVSGVANAGQLNRYIYNSCFPYLEENTEVYHMDYELGQKGYVASLVIKFTGNSDLSSYEIYNFSAVTGRYLEDAELLAVYGLTEETVRQKMIDTLNAYTRDIYPDISPTDAQVLRDRTLAEENLNEAQFLIDEEGRLCFLIGIHTYAGKGRYTTILPVEGWEPRESTPYRDCPICGNIY